MTDDSTTFKNFLAMCQTACCNVKLPFFASLHISVMSVPVQLFFYHIVIYYAIELYEPNTNCISWFACHALNNVSM